MKYVTEIKSTEQKAVVSLVQAGEGVEIHITSQDGEAHQYIGVINNNGTLYLSRMNIILAANLGIELDCGLCIKTYQL